MKGKIGKSKISEYDAQGSLESKESMDETPEFKKGGKVKKFKKGGHVDGKAVKHRLDRKARAAGGRNPFTTAEHMTGANAEDEDGKREVTGAGAETQEEVYKRGGHVKAHKKHK